MDRVGIPHSRSFRISPEESAENGLMNEAMLYVTEFTAPDGSKRRPLINRIDGCRPRKFDQGSPAALVFIPKHLSHDKWVDERFAWQYTSHLHFHRVYP